MASDELDRPLEVAQATLLARLAPDVEVRRIRWSGGETQVLELGQGPPLLLIHGGGDGAYEWVPIMPALARHHRMLAVDRPGHGLADPFDYDGVDLLQHATRFLGEVLDALRLPATDVVSNSMGGLWALALALDEPGRLNHLVIAGAPPGVTRDAPLPLRLLGSPLLGKPLGRVLMGRPSREGNRKFWGQMLVKHPDRLDDAFLDVDVEHTRRNIASVLGLVRRVVGARGVRREVMLTERLPGLETPTLFVCGDHDAFVNTRVERTWGAIADGSANVRIVRIADAGHAPWLDQPDAVVGEIERFLA